MTGSPVGLRIGAAALLAQLALQLAWHGWIAPGSRATLVLAVLPLLPCLWIISLRNLRRGVLVGGIVSLFYFCHAIADAWSDASLRGLAAMELLLSLTVFGVLYVDSRGYKRGQGDAAK
jgi:uncharacterized membrane protein